MKWVGILVVLLRGVKFGFWSHLGCSGLGFGRLCSKKKHIMLLAVVIFFRNYSKINVLSENYALCHRNYAS